MADLSLCPFCGSANVGEPIRRRPLQVACIDCGGEGPEALTHDDALTRWNTRPIEDALRAERDRLRRILAVEQGDQSAAPDGWRPSGVNGHAWRKADGSYVHLVEAARWAVGLIQGNAMFGSGPAYPSALEAMEAVDAAAKEPPP